MDNTIWLISEDALEGEIVKNILRRNNIEFITLDTSNLKKWDDADIEFINKLKKYEEIYCAGIKLDLFENMHEVYIYNNDDDNPESRMEVLSKVELVVDYINRKKEKNKVKKNNVKEPDFTKEDISKEFQEYINEDNIDEKLDCVDIFKTDIDDIEADCSKEVEYTFFKLGKIYQKNGIVNIKNQNGIILKNYEWGEEKIIGEYDLTFGEKILILVNKGEFEESIDHNINEGPIPLIPEVIDYIRLAREDNDFFDIEINSEQTKLETYQVQYNNLDLKIQEQLRVVKELKDNELLIQANEKLKSRRKQIKLKEMEDEIIKEQLKYSNLLECINEKEIQLNNQNLRVEQLTQIAAVGNSYESKIDSYKRMYLKTIKS